MRGVKTADLQSLIIVLSACIVHGFSERDFNFTGNWKHGSNPLTLQFNVSTGGDTLYISTNETTLTVIATISMVCKNESNIELHPNQSTQTSFSVTWDGFLDLLQVKYDNWTYTLCASPGLQPTCYTGLTDKGGPNPSTGFGIFNGRIRGDLITEKLVDSYTFLGESSSCVKDLCEEARKVTAERSNRVDVIEETLMRANVNGSVDLQCAKATVLNIEAGFKGYSTSMFAPRDVPSAKSPSVRIPPTLLASKARSSAKVIITYYRNFSLFQAMDHSVILNREVMGITVQNEVITELPDPVAITFHHQEPLLKTMTRQCVFWDTTKGMSWNNSGCKTNDVSEEETECLCNHLTYFAVLLQLEQKPVRYLTALTFITSLGCMLSAISCICLLVLFTRQRRRNSSSECTPVHCNLTVALLLLSLSFFFNGILASLKEPHLCRFLAVLLHYSLLCSFMWMGNEAFNAFRLVYKPMASYIPHYIAKLCLLGYGLPLIVVAVVLLSGNFYGELRIISEENTEASMCWITEDLVHYITNIGVFSVIFFFNLAMLVCLVINIQDRGPWKDKHIMLISIWGMNCLFGITWGLAFFNFGPLTVPVQFLFCIVNSLQGFFLCLRFYLFQRRSSSNQSGFSGSGSERYSLRGNQTGANAHLVSQTQ
ncbi:adhesion G-protein coupled receptor G5 isoform X1 [Amia ocellicauda]|uniref:adhesion G-protein coupled receptor G5 isoform X1 n=1 Tax=Amia ocellicauda TaxID=2972642 RepID=UPI0034642D56